MQTIHRSDKRKNPKIINYRMYRDLEELKQALQQSTRFHILDKNDKIVDCRTNGKMKTWKRDPNRIEQSFIYGLYEHFRLTGKEMLNQLVIIES